MTTAHATAFDVARVRADFPALHQAVHGHALVYLDNAATAHKPQAVLDRVARFYAAENSNVHRGVHTLSQQATDAYEAAREAVARFIGAPAREQVVFTRGTTEAVNLVAATYGRLHFGAGDEVVVTTMEHHANIVPWQLACAAAGARLRVVPLTDDGALDVEAYAALLGPRTRLVAVCHVSNALGTVNPLSELIALAHAQGVPVFVDGAQGAPHLPVDVAALEADFYAFSGHKLGAPTGIGVLYGRRALLEALPPYQSGGDMIERVSFEETTFAALPHRLEAGTPHIAGAVGLGAAVDYLEALGREALAAHEEALVAHALDRLAALDGLRLVGTARPKVSVVSFTLDGVHPYDAGLALDRLGIAVRTGHHCTQPLMERLGLPDGTVRASFAYYNTHDEVDRLADGLAEVLRAARRRTAASLPAAPPPAADPIEARMDALAEAFDAFGDDLDARRDYLMELGEGLPPLGEAYRDDAHRIHGCQSAVWLHAAFEEGRVRFAADSNALITRGLVALLVRVLDGQPPAAVLQADLDAFLARLRMADLISTSRKNGLAAMIKQMKLYALAFAKINAS